MPMQYPTLPIEHLKQDLKKSKYHDNLVFISNEENFEQALKTHKKEELFEDMFGGNFGHCTHYGNLLITENIIPKILKLIRD